MTDKLSKVHEALHTASIMGDIFDRHLLDHPAIRGNAKLRRQAEEISTKLGDLYQALGEAPGEDRE